jgi:hypothetical protein
MISNYRFINQIGDCFASLQNAQALALVYRTDLTFEIFIENGIYYYKISSEEPFPSSILQQKKRHSLSTVKTCNYDNCSFTSQKWHISSNGLIYPRGVIHFSRQGDEGLWIDLQKGFLVQCMRRPPIKEISCNYNLPHLNTRD